MRVTDPTFVMTITDSLTLLVEPPERSHAKTTFVADATVNAASTVTSGAPLFGNAFARPRSPLAETVHVKLFVPPPEISVRAVTV